MGGAVKWPERTPVHCGVIVNYGSFRINEALTAAYGEMVQYVEDPYYQQISRHATSAFLRMKLGRMLTRMLAPHIFETQDEARFSAGGRLVRPR